MAQPAGKPHDPEKWMQKAFGKHPGKLHRKLHVKPGEKIPAKKLAKASKSESGELRKEVALAKTGARIAREHSKKRR